jgi:hypothetical protein
MSFLNTYFFWFLPVLLIPLIVHLLHFRRPEKLAFSSIAFLEELQKTVVRKLRLQEWILLAIRTLFIVMLLGAFLRPFFSDINSVASKNTPIHIWIENSIGMDRIDENGPFINQAKDWASQIVSQADESQRFVISSTSGIRPPTQVLSKHEALQRIEKIEFVPGFIQFNEMFNDLPADSDQKIIFISDNHPEKLKAVLPDSSTPRHYIEWVPVGQTQQSNLSIDDINLESSFLVKDKPATIQISIRASGTEGAINGNVLLIIDDVVQGEYQVSLAGGEVKPFTFTANPNRIGYLQAQVSLKGDAYAADNKRSFSLFVPAVKQIAVITEFGLPNEDLLYMRALLDAANASMSDLQFTFLDINEIEKMANTEFSAVWLLGLKQIPSFLSPIAQNWVNRSIGLLIVPSTQSMVDSYNRFFTSLGLSTRFEGIQGSFSAPKVVSTAKIVDESHPIFEPIFELKKGKTLSYEAPNLFAFMQIQLQGNRFAAPILKTDLGSVLLVEERVQQAKILISAIGGGSSWSNFPGNALFAPTWYRAAWYCAIPESGGLFQTELGNPISFSTNSTIDEVQVEWNHQATKQIRVRKKASSSLVHYETRQDQPGWLRFNHGEHPLFETSLYLDPAYSNFKSVKIGEITDLLARHVKDIRVYDVNSKAEVNDLASISRFGSEYWIWLAVLAFLLLIAESSINYWFKSSDS